MQSHLYTLHTLTLTLSLSLSLSLSLGGRDIGAMDMDDELGMHGGRFN
jgi:hypothetical protein